MDQLMWSQSRGAGAGERAMRELHRHAGAAGIDRETGVPSVAATDSVVLLMELLADEENGEDSSNDPPSAPPPPTVGARDDGGDADRLSSVIRSLEAEIGAGAASAAATTTITAMEYGRVSEDGRRLEDYALPSCLDGYDDDDGGAPFGYGIWPPEPAAHEVGGWYVYSDVVEEMMGGIVGYEVTDQQQQQCYYYCYGYGDESVDEQVYSPLWQ